MTYKILKYPFKALMLILAVTLLPIAILWMILDTDNTFRDFCDGIDSWFRIFLQYHD